MDLVRERIPFERVVDIEEAGERVARHVFYGRTPEKAETRATRFVQRETSRAPMFSIHSFWRVFQGVLMTEE